MPDELRPELVFAMSDAVDKLLLSGSRRRA
jgi:hypothetical protein